MIFKHRPRTSRGLWHPWFAWYPVYLEDIHATAWLTTVERRIVYLTWDDEAHYRLPSPRATNQEDLS